MGRSRFRRSYIELGIDGDGQDFIAHGDTAGAYLKWDHANNKLQFIGGADMDFGSFGAPLVINQANNYPLGIFGEVSVANSEGTNVERSLWVRTKVSAAQTGAFSIFGGQMQFRWANGCGTLGSGVENAQYGGAWLYLEQDTAGQALANYAHASGAVIQVETYKNLTIPEYAHLSGLQIESRLGSVVPAGSLENVSGKIAGLFITKSPAASGVTAQNWPYGIWIESSDVAIAFADAFLGKVIETGTLASDHSKGVTLSVGNYRPVSFLFDDANAELAAAEYRGVVSRIYLAADQTAQSSIKAIRGHVKVKTGKTINLGQHRYGAVNALEGYLEFAGTLEIGSKTRVGAVLAHVELGGNLNNGHVLAGFQAELVHDGVTIDSAGIVAGLYIDQVHSEHGFTCPWPYGIYLAASGTTTGIYIGSCDVGIHLDSAAINCTGTVTQGVDSPYIGVGVSGAALDITLTDHVLGYSAYLVAKNSNAHSLIGGYFKVTTDGSNAATLTQLVGVAPRVTIDQDCSSAYATQSHLVISGSTDITQEAYAGSFYLDATGTLSAARLGALLVTLSGDATVTCDRYDVAHIVAVGGSHVDSIVHLKTDSPSTADIGLLIDNEGTMTTAISGIGVILNGVSFTGASVQTDWDNAYAYFQVGNWDTAFAVDAQLDDHFVAYQSHIDVTVAPATAKDTSCMRMRIDAPSGCGANTNIAAYVGRSTIAAVTLDSAYILHGSMSVGAATIAACYVGYLALEGSGTINGETQILFLNNKHTSGTIQGGLLVQNQSTCVLTNGIYVYNDGTMTRGIYVYGATTGIDLGSLTTAIAITGVVTNLMSLPIAGTAPVSAGADEVAHVEGSIKILVNNVAKYLHYWPDPT